MQWEMGIETVLRHKMKYEQWMARGRELSYSASRVFRIRATCSGSGGDEEMCEFQ